MTMNKAREMAKSYQSMFPEDIPIIMTEELLLKLPDIITGRIILVDVRSEEEQRISMIKGAITKDRFEKEMMMKVMENRDDVQVIVYCTVGYRSGMYCQELMRKKINCMNAEGIIVWTHLHSSLVGPSNLVISSNESDSIESNGSQSQSPVRRVHTFGAQWNVLADGYEAVYFTTFQLYYQYFRGLIWSPISRYF